MSDLMAVDRVSLRLGSRSVLRDVSLRIGSSEVVAVVGPNGAGKSSLLRVAAGLLDADEGVVAWRGQVMNPSGALARARAIAYLPQAQEVHWPMAVRAIVALGRMPHQMAGATTTERDAAAVTRAMEAADVSALADRSVLELSGGERARVLMARALAQEPVMLVADEPTAGFDVAHQVGLARVLKKLAVAGGAAMVALHDLTMAANVAQRVVLMKDGQIVADGAPRDVLTELRLAGVYGVTMRTVDIDGTAIFVPRY